MKLYNYFRSSAAYRVRIALHLKGLAFDYEAVHLRMGEQHADAYRALNRQELVPTLIDGETVVTQSLAIIEYLNERHPEPPLLPSTPAERARVRAIALAIACDIHPLNNLRALRYLMRTLSVGEEAKDAWYRHWIDTGLAALEARPYEPIRRWPRILASGVTHRVGRSLGRQALQSQLVVHVHNGLLPKRNPGASEPCASKRRKRRPRRGRVRSAEDVTWCPSGAGRSRSRKPARPPGRSCR